MHPARVVIARLARLGVRYYVTGSEALAIYAEPRQTQDTDLVVGLGPGRYARRIRPAFEDAYAVSDPMRSGHRTFGSLIATDGSGKVDLIMRDDDAWGRSAFERRVLREDPGLGRAWFSSPEDLLLAKLEWSEGRSELQLRDCRSIVRLDPALDWPYLERWAAQLGLMALLESIGAG